jgi:hypothetical protein
MFHGARTLSLLWNSGILHIQDLRSEEISYLTTYGTVFNIKYFALLILGEVFENHI